ncbi:MAG: hypothetical protein IT456_03955 [Planctomycetes bacterium]|jgi:hypothetical protein|nr:hypothetical protein [Planctomycetota bacterium]
MPTDVVGMENDLCAGACAASDLAARLATEVARANADLEAAEQRFRAAASHSPGGQIAVPFGIRRDVSASRRRLAALQQVLSGILDSEGGFHAASA